MQDFNVDGVKFLKTSTIIIIIIIIIIVVIVGWNIIVGIATCYGLDGWNSNLGRARFSATVQTGPGTHPASCNVDNGYFSRGKIILEQPGRSLYHPPHPAPRLKKE